MKITKLHISSMYKTNIKKNTFKEEYVVKIKEKIDLKCQETIPVQMSCLN